MDDKLLLELDSSLDVELELSTTEETLDEIATELAALDDAGLLLPPPPPPHATRPKTKSNKTEREIIMDAPE